MSSIDTGSPCRFQDVLIQTTLSADGELKRVLAKGFHSIHTESIPLLFRSYFNKSHIGKGSGYNVFLKS